jgi:galactokinase
MSAWTARAPGRLDVMGGIADYSGSLVLQWPIRESTTVRLQFVPGDAGGGPAALRVISRDAGGTARSVEVPLALVNDARAPYDDVRAWFAESPTRHWAAYAAGVFAVLAGEHGAQFSQGAVIEIESDVPEGKGVSSSAALEAATLTVLLGAIAARGAEAPPPQVPVVWRRGFSPAVLPPRDQALLCQRAENLVVGAPCGVMDQMAVICGRAGHLMALLCQPAELQPPLRLPDELAVFGIDSGIRHAVTGSDYTSVRVGAFMGYRILADMAGLAVRPGTREGHVIVDDPRWHGALANVGREAFHEYEVHIPNTLQGSVFLQRYGGTTDLVTRVHPDRCYPVWTPTAHPIYEHGRVSEWARLLQEPDRPGRAARLGELMYQSHASYGACGLGSDGTDLLVDLAREAGEAQGVYGAKITGGGSGGTVAVLARADAVARVHAIAKEYGKRTGRQPYVFEGTSEGAAVTGASVSTRG